MNCFGELLVKPEAFGLAINNSHDIQSKALDKPVINMPVYSLLPGAFLIFPA